MAQREELIARIGRLEAEVAAVRAELEAGSPPQRVAPAPAEPVAAALPQSHSPTRVERPDLTWLTGPRGLALAGGLVTLLGIVFVFALASSRGWIGPGVRCAIGAVVSAALVGAAVLVRRRYGLLTAAVAAAGAGIGGGYVTLYAASHGYHLLPDAAVFSSVVAIAAVAVALSLAWDAELLAALGLVTVVVAPPLVDGELTSIGLGASILACATAVALGQARRWEWLGALSFAALFVQACVYVIDAHSGGEWFGTASVPRGAASAVAVATWVIAVAAATAYQRTAGRRLDRLSGVLASSTVPLSLLSVWALAGSGSRALALVVVATAYAAAASVALAPRLRELGELLAALGLLFFALATAAQFSNAVLALAWSLEGLVLVAAAVRLGRRRYQVAGLAYLAAAGVHVLTLDTPLRQLFRETGHPAAGLGALLVLAACVSVAGLLLRSDSPFAEHVDVVALAAGALLALYAASLGVLALAQDFQRGETLVSTLWAVVALSLLAAGLTRGWRDARLAGFALLGLALAKLFLFDLAHLSSLARAGSFLAVGLTLLAGGFLVQRAAAES